MKFEQIDRKKKLITGIGSPLIDILAYENEEFLEKTGAVKGGMKYVDREFIEQTLSFTTQQPVLVLI